EPVGDHSTTGRERIVKATLNNEQREKLAPGLSDVVDGPIEAELTRIDDTRQSGELDLTRAALSAPWIGWTKGSGIPAKASFELAGERGAETISKFQLDGDGFGASGALTLRKGSLDTAEFSRMRLSPEDNYSLSLKRTGGGFDVSIAGSSVDMRPVITRLRSTGEESGDADKTENVTVRAKLDRMV